MALNGYTNVSAQDLSLPICPLPRAGESVVWYSDSRLVTGQMTGHNVNGKPLIINQFNNPHIANSFDDIRVENPLNRKGPNWTDLPENAIICVPPSIIVSKFDHLLNQRIPPGPSYMDLAMEIWSRGFEVFVVGGTVRDIIAGEQSHDVDLVTTMPLFVALRFLRSMYRYDPSKSSNTKRGFIRLGGTPSSGDPFIDLKVFSDSLAGTDQATFGVGFERDVAHRDFAMNAVYYDPINRVLIDPTGNGIDDIVNNRLNLICDVEDAFQHAQIFVRYFKFIKRGFSPTQETTTIVCEDFATKVPVMKFSTRAKYIQAQVLSKCNSPNDHRTELEAIRVLMQEGGVGQVWDDHFKTVCEDLIS